MLSDSFSTWKYRMHACPNIISKYVYYYMKQKTSLKLYEHK